MRLREGTSDFGDLYLEGSILVAGVVAVAAVPGFETECCPGYLIGLELPCVCFAVPVLLVQGFVVPAGEILLFLTAAYFGVC